jgi:hypothetical protein
MAVQVLDASQDQAINFSMTQKHMRRSSPHQWIDTIWQTECLSDGIYSATPDGSWDLISIEKPDGRRIVFITGQATEPVENPYEKGERSVVISFSAHVYLATRDEVLTGSTLLFLRVEGDSFILNEARFPLPTFHNAEDVVDRMVAQGLLRSDELVRGALEGKPKAASRRATQHHFKTVTGITQKNFQMIRRAQEAVKLIKMGRSAAEVAADLGYADQAHMIHSIKKLMGKLPTNLDDVHKI